MNAEEYEKCPNCGAWMNGTTHQTEKCHALTAHRWDDETVVITGTENGQTATIAHIYETKENEEYTRLIAASPQILRSLKRVKTELAHLYHNGQVKANAPERARIEKMILDAEYLIETVEG